METQINNGENRTNVEYFKPLLQRFISKNKNLYEESGYPFGLFIPYTMPNYINAPIKIFYAGIDTDYWTDKSVMLNGYNDNNLEDYFFANQSNVTAEKSIKNWGNNAGAFWSFVNKFHLFIRTGKICDLTQLSEDEMDIIKEIGYGNLNCMELNKTLGKKGYDNSNLDIEKLSLLRKESREFDKIEHILNAYNPDFIVILNWEDRDDYFGNIKFNWHKDLYIDKIRAVYTLEGYNTKIIWGPHPNRFKYLGKNQENMIRELGDLILSFINSAD